MPGTHQRVERSASRRMRHATRVGLLLLVAVYASSCTRFSVREEDEAAGFNGGFEIVRNDLPVNWNVHYPPVRDGDAEVMADTGESVEGRQSLKLVVHRVNGPGWHSAGIFQVVPAEPGQTYRVGFQLRNEGARLQVRIVSTDAKMGADPRIERLDTDDTGVSLWRSFAYTYTVPESYANLRVEFDALGPGTFWIDDVHIETTTPE